MKHNNKLVNSFTKYSIQKVAEQSGSDLCAEIKLRHHKLYYLFVHQNQFNIKRIIGFFI